MSVITEVELEDTISKLIKEKLNPGLLDEVEITVQGNVVNVDFTRLEERNILYFVTKQNFDKYGIQVTNSALTRITRALSIDELVDMPADEFFRIFFGFRLMFTNDDGKISEHYIDSKKSLENETALGKKSVEYLRSLLVMLLFQEATTTHWNESEYKAYFARQK